MLDKNGIRLALRQILLTLPTVAAGDVTLPDFDELIAWENVAFTPPPPNVQDPKSCIWLRETIAWGQERQISYGYLELIAVANYDVYTPAGAGTEDAENLAKAIGDVFKPTAGEIVDGSETPSGQQVQVSIVRAETGAGHRMTENDPWFIVPVRITFRAYGTY